MTIRIGPLKARVREARDLVDANPEVVEAISAEDKAAAKAAAEQDKRVAAARAKAEVEAPECARLLEEDFWARFRMAVSVRATIKARALGEYEHVTKLTMKPEVWAPLTPSPRLSFAEVLREMERSYDEEPLPWDPAGRSAVQWRSDEARAAAKARQDREAAEAARLAPPPDDREERREAARQAEIDEAKRKAKVGKYAPGAGS